jgi:hypothetical protein
MSGDDTIFDGDRCITGTINACYVLITSAYLLTLFPGRYHQIYPTIDRSTRFGLVGGDGPGLSVTDIAYLDRKSVV